MKNDVYGEPEVIQFKNAVVTVYSPIISDQEWARRMELIKQATARLVLSKKPNRSQES